MLSDYTKEEVENIVKGCNSIKEVAVKLGYSSKRSGKVLSKISNYLKSEGISTYHFKNINNIRSLLKLEDVFKKDSPFSNTSIKRRVVVENLIEYSCAICGNIGSHNGKSLKLQLDHIDGCNTNNSLDNLRFLCPNCHSQTDTFGGRNKSYK